MKYLAAISFLFLLLPAGAKAETAGANFSLHTFAKPSPKKFQPARLSWGINIFPEAGAPTILPLRRADLRFPRAMRLQPSRKLEPCTLSDTLLVVPPEVISSRCPNSIVGNGVASFQLASNASPVAYRKGTVVILWGGRAGRDHRLRFAAWSGDTGAGIVAEGVLSQGLMRVEIPSLTADSAVTSLQLSIPGKTIKGQWNSGSSYTVPAGSDRGFVRGKCKKRRRLLFGASLLLGKRDAAGTPYGDTQIVSAKKESRC